jgi:hypothetical protein
MLDEGVAAIFGPSTTDTSGIASSICKAVEVPHIITHWERDTITDVGSDDGSDNENDSGSDDDDNGDDGEDTASPFTLNLYPDAEVLSRAYADLLIDYTWKSYTIIYEDDDSLMRLKDILQIHDPQSPPVTVR